MIRRGKALCGAVARTRWQRVWPAALAVSGLAVAVPAGGSAAVERSLASPPVNAAAPAISGVVRQGQTLSASSGSWSGATPITFSVSWQRCDASGSSCATIGGATAFTYALASADVGRTVRVLVVATNADGSAQALSLASAMVAEAGRAPANTAQPDPSGTPQDGQTVTVGSGGWSGTLPIAYAYQWQRCTAQEPVCTDVAGATAQTYKVGPGEVGFRLRAKVTATNDLGSTSVTSNLTDVVARAGLPPVNTTLPLIVGVPTVGRTLNVGLGTWTGSSIGGFAYEWSRCNATGSGCSPIPAATGSSYRLAAADAGRSIRVTVTATNPAGSAGATSVATEPVTPAAVAGLRLAATLTARGLAPAPLGTRAGMSGTFTATLSGTTLRWTLRWTNLSGLVAATQVDAGTRGKVGTLLFGLTGRQGSPASGTTTVTRAEVATLLRGGAYVTVLTAKNPKGELRGQIHAAL
jgi:CHRD domain